jgi:hypothetical protein
MSEKPAQPLAPEVLAELKTEAKNIEEDSTYSAKGHFEGSDIWAHRNLWIGIPTSVAAAIAGVAALKAHPVLAGILAMLVAASSAVSTFLNPRDKSTSHLKAGNAYKALQNDARIFWRIECLHRATDPALVNELKALNDRRNALNTESPQFSRTAFERARKGIEGGEATYATEKAKPAGT